jgi:peptidoglycan hydrolase CwlO-like protein
MNLRLPHRETGVTNESLSDDLRAKVVSLDLRIDQYLNNPLDEKLKKDIEHQSAKLGHAMLDFQKKEQEKVAAAASAEQQSSAEQKQPEQQSATEQKQPESTADTRATNNPGSGLFDLF